MQCVYVDTTTYALCTSDIVRIVNILLINNSSTTFGELEQTVIAAGHTITSITHKEIPNYTASDFDAAVLSGGWWYDDEVELLEQYAEELGFIRNCPIPLLGICIGMQLMHVAIDQAVPLLDEPQQGYKSIASTALGAQVGLPPSMLVYKLHTRGILEADPSFTVLATSPGHIEIIRHTTRPMLGVQFHPEVNDTLEGAAAHFSQLLNLIITKEAL